MPPLSSTHNRRLSFSLTELMIVTAILMVLISLLQPSLKKALSTARAMTCSNMIKELQTDTFLFVDDHDGYMPKLFYQDLLPEHQNTYFTTKDMWNNGVNWGWQTNRISNLFIPYIQDFKRRTCPEDPHIEILEQRTDHDLKWQNMNSYSAPMDQFTLNNNFGSNGLFVYRTLNSRSNPEQLFMYLESTKIDQYMYYRVNVGNDKAYENFMPFHLQNKGMSVGYFDGHAEIIHLEGAPLSYTDGPLSLENWGIQTLSPRTMYDP